MRFTITLDPNNGTGVVSPQYMAESLHAQVYTFPISGAPNIMTALKIRANALAVLCIWSRSRIPSEVALILDFLEGRLASFEIATAEVDMLCV